VATRGAFVAHVCHVVRFYPLQGVLLIRISATPLDMSEACSPSMAYKMDVVDDNHLYQTCLITIACLE
jgi:hypothetical protein